MVDEPTVLRELHRLEERIDQRLSCVEEKLDTVRTEDLPAIRVGVAADIATLKVKAGLWGLVAGVLGSIGMILISLLTSR
jgi:hypothetical protein